MKVIWCWLAGHKAVGNRRVWLSDLWTCVRCKRRYLTSRNGWTYGVAIRATQERLQRYEDLSGRYNENLRNN